MHCYPEETENTMYTSHREVTRHTSGVHMSDCMLSPTIYTNCTHATFELIDTAKGLARGSKVA